MKTHDINVLVGGISYRLNNPQVFIGRVVRLEDKIQLKSFPDFLQENYYMKAEFLSILLRRNSDTKNHALSNAALQMIENNYLAERSYLVDSGKTNNFHNFMSFVINLYAENNVESILQGHADSPCECKNTILDADRVTSIRGSYSVRSYNTEVSSEKDYFSLFNTNRLYALNEAFVNLFNHFPMDYIIDIMKTYGYSGCTDFIDNFVYPIVNTSLDDFSDDWAFNHNSLLLELLKEGDREPSIRSLPLEWQIEMLKSQEKVDR